MDPRCNDLPSCDDFRKASQDPGSRIGREFMKRSIVALLLVFGAACSPNIDTRPAAPTAVAQPQPAGQPKRIQLDRNVFLEIDGKTKRVIVETKVCLRQGSLEQFMTRKRTKEHEAIVVADCDASKIHAGLILCGAESGSPVKFLPKFAPPTGTVIKVTVEYKDGDKTIRRPAQEWIRDSKTKKDLVYDWVFAGSRLFPDPEDPKKPPYYLANDGDIICVSNFDTALLDLPIESTVDNSQLQFDAHTERIPAIDTPVTVILEPVLPKKDGKTP
jgi:hypothetical protein